MKTSMAVSVQKTSFQAVVFEEAILPLLTLLRDLRFDGAELAIRNPLEVDVPRLQERLASLSLPVPALGTGQAYLEEGLSLSSLDDSVTHRAMERILTHIRLAANLGSLVIIGLIRGRLPDETGQRDRAFAAFQENLRELCSIAGKLNVSLVLEPLNRYETNFLNTLEEAAICIEALGVNNLGILADTFHMNIEEVNMAASLERHGCLVSHVHIADSNRRAPGMGHLDFRPVYDVLGNLGYNGYYSAEIVPHPTFHEAARQARNFFTTLTGYDS
ncbi:MAG TPA: 5-keto-L-gluconate epimerase [Atribacteraceae bacterium]|nr:5-keto-L-gluconate epimerase [Atribacteraceae bacterium]